MTRLPAPRRPEGVADQRADCCSAGSPHSKLRQILKQTEISPEFSGASHAAWQLGRDAVGTVSCFSNMDTDVQGKYFNMIMLGPLHVVTEAFEEF